MAQPCPGTPESLAFWKPVLDEIRKKLEARGWFDATCVGHSHPYGPLYAPIVDNYRKIWPDGVWARTAHGSGLGGGLPGTDNSQPAMPIRYSEGVWVIPAPTARGYRSLLDPKRPQCLWYATRQGPRPPWPLDTMRRDQERHIMEQCEGVNLGADIFPRKGAGGRYDFEACNRGDLGPFAEGIGVVLAPGADGPIPTERFEMFREGQELAEAILFLERLLQEKKIGGDLAERVNRCLDARSELVMRGWFGPTDMAGQDAKLLALAGEAAAATLGK
jgi:hypothetical protein